MVTAGGSATSNGDAAMSDETATILDKAISNHIANVFPGFYTEGWIIVAVSATLDSPRGKNYRILTPDAQPLHADSGLLEIGKLILNDQWVGATYDEDEDEDG